MNQKEDQQITKVESADAAAGRNHLRSALSQRLSIDSLADNYHNLISQQGVFYPVAYRFGRELGRGRQGIVFTGYRHGSRGCVTRHAIKLFDPGIYPSAEKYWSDMGRIAAQVSRLQSLNCPNLIGRDIYDEADGIGYIQMEVIRGLDCQQMLYGNHLDRARAVSTEGEWRRFTDAIFRMESGKRLIQPGIALYIMRQILRGLEVLHTTGFLHSDVKPSNLMIDQLGIVKLVDYGRAVRVNERTTFLLGTPLYMAPEIHRRAGGSIQSDIYSVGLVGLELLRGERLADVQELSEDQLLEVKLKLPETLSGLLPAHVRKNEDFLTLLRKFLDPNPENRYETAEDAESVSEGLALLHKQLTMLGIDSEYDRELQGYITKLFPEEKPDDVYHDEVLA
jgi:eukaryotic-like serine/threonine-protein kinase